MRTGRVPPTEDADTDASDAGVDSAAETAADAAHSIDDTPDAPRWGTAASVADYSTHRLAGVVGAAAAGEAPASGAGIADVGAAGDSGTSGVSSPPGISTSSDASEVPPDSSGVAAGSPVGGSNPYGEARVQVVLGPGESASVRLECDFEPERILADPDVRILQLRRDAAVKSL